MIANYICQSVIILFYYIILLYYEYYFIAYKYRMPYYYCISYRLNNLLRITRNINVCAYAHTLQY